MTNAEINQQAAVAALNAGKLTDYEAKFVREISGYTKKELRGLTSKQYDLLVRCANKA